MPSFLWRPRWLLSHVFVLALVVAFVNLGFWQLRRLDERRDRNELLEARMAEAPVPVEQVVGRASTDAEVDAVAYRPVTAAGTWAPDEQVLIANRTNGGQAGFWVVTPLVLGDGTALAVNRGWVPQTATDLDGGGREYPPAAGEVQVSGLLLAPQVREGIGASTPDGDRLTTLPRVDVARLDAQSPLELLPAYVDLVAQTPPVDDLPEPVEAPELDEGPHLNYAGQWFIFTTIALVGYPLFLRRHARQLAAGDTPGPAPGGGAGAEPAEPVGAAAP